MQLSAERLTPGCAPDLTEHEHWSRYRFAAGWVSGKRVADVACGTGYGSQLLAQSGAIEVIGLDVSADSVEFAQEHYQADRLCFAVGDAQRLDGVPDSAVDIVVSFETIEHLADVDSYLKEMFRILRPGGSLLVSTPDRRIASVLYPIRRVPENQFHLHEFTERELVAALERHFEVVEIFGQSFVPSTLVFMPVQALIKAVCRLIGSPRAREFKDAIYTTHGDVEVVSRRLGVRSVAKYWVVHCRRPEA